MSRALAIALGKRAADITNMFGFQGEGEVLFRAHTGFMVDKVEGQMGKSNNATFHVYMTEVDLG